VRIRYWSLTRTLSWESDRAKNYAWAEIERLRLSTNSEELNYARDSILLLAVTATSLVQVSSRSRICPLFTEKEFPLGAMHEDVERRQSQQGEERSGNKSSHHHNGKRFFDFRLTFYPGSRSVSTKPRDLTCR
jgi:hypothetical protein